MTNPYDNDEESPRSGPAGEAAVGEAADGESPAADGNPIAELRRERDALQDRVLRLAAEFDNYRKRIDRERRDQANAASADALADLLPIIDDLERALQAPSGGDADVYRRGVELIHRHMMELLRKRGVKPVPTVGTAFDPRVHQAVVDEVSTKHKEGEVMEELRRGYTLGDRLLRPAMVKVAKA
jgi:molecular chaperone GrpE